MAYSETAAVDDFSLVPNLLLCFNSQTMASNTYFTSESVCSGHPDKICDQISDSILDGALREDRYSRVAVETLVTTNQIVLAGEVTTSAKLDFKTIVKKLIKKLGYDKPVYRFDDTSPVDVFIHQQSPEIARGVDHEGAGDQGMMFGFACQDTAVFMPMPIMLAHALAKSIDRQRDAKTLPYLRPDGKTQVTVRYENGKPKSVEKVVVAVPHDKHISLSQVKDEVFTHVISPVFENYKFTVKKNQIIVNGTGAWHIGGPSSDTGVTGRKIIVDTYGGYARIGGGCFSGKDPTKVDRSGAYAARFIAKNIVAHGLAEKAEVALAYCIGQKNPLMKMVDTFGTAKVKETVLNSFVDDLIDTSVSGIINALDLRKPIYLPTAVYGHFGKEGVSWEKVVK